MRRLSIFLYFQVLVLSMVAGVLLGCGGWFAKRQAEEKGQGKIQTSQADTGVNAWQWQQAKQAGSDTTLKQVEQTDKLPKPTFTYDSYTRKYTFPYLPTDSKRLQEITEKVITEDTLRFSYVQRFFKSNAVCMDTMEFIKSYHDDLGLGPNDELLHTKDSHTPFGQFHKGVRVLGAGFALSFKNDCIIKVSGGVWSNLDVNTTPTLSRIEALQCYWDKYVMPMDTAQLKSVMKQFAQVFTPNTPDNFNIKGGGADIRIKGSYKKGWLKSDTIDASINIAYTFILPIHGEGYYVYIDAHSGLVKYTRESVAHASVGTIACETGNVHTEYGGYGGFTPLSPQTYDVDGVYQTIENIYNETAFVLETDNNCYSNIELHTYNEFISPPANGTYIVNTSNNWIDDATFHHYATLFWVTQQVYDYYETKFGLTGWYNSNTNTQETIRIAVEYPTASPKPYLGWGTYTAALGDGHPCIRVASANNALVGIYDDWDNLIQASTVWGNLSGIDLIGHEYTHAIDHYYGQNLYQWQPIGGLGNPDYLKKVTRCSRFLESICDIMGACIEHSVKGSYDWLFMHHLTNGKRLQRSFKNPNNFSYHIAEDCAGDTKTYLDGQPSYYNQPGFYDNGTCEDDYYVNGGVLNHWFYLLVKGNMPNGTTINGNTYYVEPIGNVGQDSVAKARDIVYRVFLDNTPSNSKFDPNEDDFPEICAKTLLAANALYPPTGGLCSPELQAVYNAWKAVGVNCPLPAGIICSLCTENELNITLQTDCYTNYVTNNFFLCGTPPFNIEGTYYYPSGGFISDIFGNTNNYFFAHTIQNNGTYTYQDLPVMYEITDAGGNIQTINSLNCCEVRTSSVTSACAFNESNGSYIVNINIAYQYYAPSEAYTISVSYENATGQQFTQTFVDSDGNQNSQISVPDAAANTPITFTITDWRGCSLSGSIPQINNTDCETLIEGIVVGSGSYNSPPAFTQMPPAMLSVCAGQQICLPYQATDINGDNANITLSGLPPVIALTQTINQSGSTSIGEICFTPPLSWVNTTIQLHLLAFDYQNITYAPLTLSVLCCPTGFNHPQELTALYDCNGNLYQPAEATVTALTNNCSINFTVNGSSNHTLTGLGAGVYDLTLEFNNEIIQIPDAITVTGIYLDDTGLQVTHTAQPSLAACNTDQCTGQITLSVTGGTSNYTYLWSDCQSCNSPVRNHLCAGSYTATVTDDETGCQTVYTANVGQSYPATAGTLSDNEFSVAPTVFSGSTTLTYRVAYDAQVSIAMYNSQGNLVAQPLANELKTEGEYSLTHTPPAGLPQGIYFYVLYVCEQPLTRVAVKVQ